MAFEYWDLITQDLDLKSISKRQLRDRLKKSAISLESQFATDIGGFISQLFPELEQQLPPASRLLRPFHGVMD